MPKPATDALQGLIEEAEAWHAGRGKAGRIEAAAASIWLRALDDARKAIREADMKSRRYE